MIISCKILGKLYPYVVAKLEWLTGERGPYHIRKIGQIHCKHLSFKVVSVEQSTYQIIHASVVDPQLFAMDP